MQNETTPRTYIYFQPRYVQLYDTYPGNIFMNKTAGYGEIA